MTDEWFNTCKVCEARLMPHMLTDEVGRRTSNIVYLHRAIDGPFDHEAEPRWVRDDG